MVCCRFSVLYAKGSTHVNKHLGRELGRVVRNQLRWKAKAGENFVQLVPYCMCCGLSQREKLCLLSEVVRYCQEVHVTLLASGRRSHDVASKLPWLLAVDRLQQTEGLPPPSFMSLARVPRASRFTPAERHN